MKNEATYSATDFGFLVVEILLYIEGVGADSCSAENNPHFVSSPFIFVSLIVFMSLLTGRNVTIKKNYLVTIILFFKLNG